MVENFDIIVTGGGASGLMAAGRAGECRAKTLLLEKTARLGNKLLMSGKGRCNLTNITSLDNFIKSFSKSGSFLYNAFGRFFNTDLIDFFAALRLDVVVERGGRVFPKSNSASSVVETLKKYIENFGIKIKFKTQVTDILVEGNHVAGVQLADGRKVFSKCVILATGGLSYPKTGSTGDGFKIAQRLGHKINTLRPGLVPLETKEDFVRNLSGLQLENIKASVIYNNKVVETEFGDLLFTHFGISGPLILTLSSKIAQLLEKQTNIYLSINLKPALNIEQLDNRLMREFKKCPNKILKNLLRELLPQRLIAVFLSGTGMRGDIKVNQITKTQRQGILNLFTDFRLTITKTKPIAEAIITQGGVTTDEINPKTMESKLIKGLYFCGELIDVDAKTGGFNLQAAFSTGRIAGESAALGLCSQS